MCCLFNKLAMRTTLILTLYTLLQRDIIPESVRYWEDTLKVRPTVGPIKLLPQCVSDRVRYKDGDSHPYCVDGCAPETTCGETVVPSNHLDVSCFEMLFLAHLVFNLIQSCIVRRHRWRHLASASASVHTPLAHG